MKRVPAMNSVPSIHQVTDALERIAPLRLAADWDAVGLLVGTHREGISRVMTCLSLTPEVAREATREEAHLVVTHHPMPFRPVSRITDGSGVGRVLLELLGAGVAVWSGHTAWDSAAGGINDQLATAIGLEDRVPIQPDALNPLVGFGRVGMAQAGWTVAHLSQHIAKHLGVEGVHVAGDPHQKAGRVGIVCGSGGELGASLQKAGCNTLVTGEIKLHGAIEAQANGLAVVAVGHHASEHFSMAVLAHRLAEALPALHCWASRDEVDPLQWLMRSP